MDVAGFLKGFSTFIWFAWFVVLVLTIVQSARRTPIKKAKSFVLIGLAVAVIASTISSGLVFINPEERGVVISAVDPDGYRDEALEPGLRWIVPFAESVVIYPVSHQTYTMSIATDEGEISGDDSIAARTLDGQEIYIDASIIYSIDPTKVVDVHINWQDRYPELIRAQARGIIRDEVSQYSIQEIVSTKRVELIQNVTDKLSTKVAENGLVLDDFVLRNIAFSEEYAASVEQKQIAEQQAQQAAFVVEQKKQEAEQARQVALGAADAAVTKAQGEADARLIEADAEARALTMIAEVIKNNPNLLNYQYITNLSDNISVMMVPSDSPFILPFPETTTSGTSQ